MAWAHDQPCGITGEAEAGDEQDDDPEFSRADSAQWAVGAFGEQWQDDEGHQSEPEPSAEAEIGEVFDDVVEAGFLDEQDGGGGDEGA